VPVAQELRKHDPTGIGDGFRSGFFAGLSWELGLERSAQIGSLVATYVIETVGTQEYQIKPAEFVDRFGDAYGADAAEEIRPHLPW
jgi:adenosine kinase